MVSGARKEKSEAITLISGGSAARPAPSEQAASGTSSRAVPAKLVSWEVMAVEANRLRVRVVTNYPQAYRFHSIAPIGDRTREATASRHSACRAADYTVGLVARTSASRALTSRLTSVDGVGLSSGNRTVPLDVS